MRAFRNIPIVVAAYNRSHVLQRLLMSLQNAEYSCPAMLIISIDGGGSQEVVKMAREFRWEFGEKHIIAHKKHLGLRRHILACAGLSQEHDGLILLEDDLYVSPMFYQYALQATEFYHADERIASVSLYSQQFNETARFPFEPLQDGSDVFFLQIPSSWGQSWTRDQWKQFQDWYEKEQANETARDLPLPENLLEWPETSWKKHFFKYMMETDKYCVYPRVSYTTNFGDEGTHHKGNKAFQVPLQYAGNEFSFRKMRESCAVYDAFCEIVPDRLKQLVPEFGRYDFAVDLYGTKPLGTINCEYILTTKPCASPIFSYGKEMKPLVANVIGEIPGDKIFFGAKEQCKDLTYREVLMRCNNREELLYHYSLLGYIHLVTSNAQIEKLQVEIQNIYRSITYRVGKTILWPAQLYTKVLTKIENTTLWLRAISKRVLKAFKQ